MPEFNLECPKFYGKITFVVRPDFAFCPISGKTDCVECDVVRKGELGEDKQVKRETNR